MLYSLLLWTAKIFVVLVILFLLFWRVYFLRKPARDVPKKGIVSPASGTVGRVFSYGGKKVEVPKGMLGKVKVLTKDVAAKGKIVVIVMTAFDVHYQRAPIDGVVEKVKHSKGRFLNAVKDARDLKATFENEKNEMLIKGKGFNVKVVQVAGFVARRIECFVKNKQKVHKGEELGRINLGSQVILVMPECKVLVKEGDRVVDGETVIAKSSS